MNEAKDPSEGRRHFFRSLGRGLVLGAGGAGVVWMARGGRLDPSRCIDEHGPCRTCIAETGCSLPKAEAYRKGGRHG